MYEYFDYEPWLLYGVGHNWCIFTEEPVPPSSEPRTEQYTRRVERRVIGYIFKR